ASSPTMPPGLGGNFPPLPVPVPLSSPFTSTDPVDVDVTRDPPRSRGGADEGAAGRGARVRLRRAARGLRRRRPRAGPPARLGPRRGPSPPVTGLRAPA